MTTYFIEQFHDPDRAIANPWCIEDVKLVREELTDVQAYEVLQEVIFNYDAVIGINWDVIASETEELFPSKPVFKLST
ncbi:hypothetical protein G4P69_30130 [Aetokthonos hydrillicola CCALA 1050]|nr:hypothetical protein [Aetokthonos hydrillicola CCALA 1050]